LRILCVFAVQGKALCAGGGFRKPEQCSQP